MSQKDRINTVAKGSRLEYQIVWDLQQSGLDPTARRSSVWGKTSRSTGSSVDGDIMTKLPLCIEAKNTEQIKGLYKFWQQAVNENKIPSRRTSILVVKSNDNLALACMAWQDYLELLKFALMAKWPDG